MLVPFANPFKCIKEIMYSFFLFSVQTDATVFAWWRFLSLRRVRFYYSLKNDVVPMHLLNVDEVRRRRTHSFGIWILKYYRSAIRKRNSRRLSHRKRETIYDHNNHFSAGEYERFRTGHECTSISATFWLYLVSFWRVSSPENRIIERGNVVEWARYTHGR